MYEIFVTTETSKELIARHRSRTLPLPKSREFSRLEAECQRNEGTDKNCTVRTFTHSIITGNIQRKTKTNI